MKRHETHDSLGSEFCEKEEGEIKTYWEEKGKASLKRRLSRMMRCLSFLTPKTHNSVDDSLYDLEQVNSNLCLSLHSGGR
jgi:hypothetical protein